MRTIRKAWMALSVIALLPMTATADFIDAGTTTVDTATGLEWLDLTETSGLSYNDVSSQFGAGGALHGWRYASMEETQTLFTNLGLTLAFQFGHVTSAPAGFTAALSNFVSLFGDTAGELNSSFFGALGITAQSYYSNSHHMMGAYTFFSGTKYNLQTSLSYCCHFADDDSDIYRGSYLVKATAVPEPGTLFLLGLGLVGIGFVKRKNV